MEAGGTSFRWPGYVSSQPAPAQLRFGPTTASLSYRFAGFTQYGNLSILPIFSGSRLCRSVTRYAILPEGVLCRRRRRASNPTGSPERTMASDGGTGTTLGPPPPAGE
jgi:hypothetical protein